MGTALKYLRDFFDKIGIELDKRAASSLLILLLLLILLPIGLILIKNQLTFLPRAAGELIQLGEGGCIKLNKDKKKVVDCPTVPLRLNNPFLSAAASASPSTPRPSGSNTTTSSPSPSPSGSAGTSVSPSPSASVGLPRTVRVSGNTNVEIQAALNLIRDSGGAVYLPAGTYTINDKIRLYSNTTIFGDGPGQTILQLTQAVVTDTEPIMSNDSNRGQNNIVVRDMTLKGLGTESGIERCCPGLRFANLDGGYIINVEAKDFSWNGIYLGYHDGIGVKNVRVSGSKAINNKGAGIAIALGSNNVIDGNTVSGNNFSSDPGKQDAAINLEIGVEGGINNNKVLNNSVTNNENAGISLKADPGFQVANNAVCNNTSTGNGDVGIADEGGSGNVYIANSISNNQDRNDGKIVICDQPNGVCNNASSGIVEDESPGATNAACGIPANLANLPAAPAKPAASRPSWFSQLLNTVNELIASSINSMSPDMAFAAAGYSSVTSNGCGEIIAQPAQGSANGSFTFKAPMRVGNEWQTQKQDGTVVTQQQIQQTGLADPRVGNTTFLGSNYINCDVFIQYSDGVSCTVESPPKGREGVAGGKLAPGESVTFSVKSSNESNSPGCRIQLQTEVNSDSDDDFTDGEDSDSGDQFVNGNASPAASFNTSPLPGNFVQYRLAESQAGLAQAQWKQFAFAPAKDSIFDKLAGLFGLPEVFAQDSDDNFLDGEDSDSGDQFLNGSATPSGSLNPAGSAGATNLGPQFIDTTYILKDIKPGSKQIWVEYRHPDGTTKVGNVTFDLVDKTPQILGLSCNLDVSKQNLLITVSGDHFGNDIGKAATVEPNNNIEITGWNNKQVTGVIKSPNIPVNEGQRYKVKVTRPDGFESGTAVCAVDKSLISLGARIFCREPGKFDAKDVAVTIVYNKEDSGANSLASKVEEKVTINKDGEIDNLKTQLQVGKNYAIAVKAPGSLRRSALFTAMEGTTEIVRADGGPFILPVGDIAPTISPDGQINTLDRAELIRQWRVLNASGSATTASTTQSGDFNRDSKVNSIDWACMQYDFGSGDDPIPVEVPGSASGSINIQAPASGTITIPISSPTPRPSSSPVTQLLQKTIFLLLS